MILYPVKKKDEKNNVALKSKIAMWLCLKLPFILEFHEISLNVTKRKILSRIFRYIYIIMLTRFLEKISSRYTG